MARCIDADKFAERIKVSPAFRNIDDGFFLQRVVIDLLNNMPTADVVPKSEVKRVYYNLQAVLEERAETKQEIAREIFEELARKSTYVFPTMLYTIAKRDVDELKNKYIGGNDNG